MPKTTALAVATLAGALVAAAVHASPAPSSSTACRWEMRRVVVTAAPGGTLGASLDDWEPFAVTSSTTLALGLGSSAEVFLRRCK